METFLRRCDGDLVFGKFSLFFLAFEIFSLYLLRRSLNVGDIYNKEVVAEMQQNGN